MNNFERCNNMYVEVSDAMKCPTTKQVRLSWDLCRSLDSPEGEEPILRGISCECLKGITNHLQASWKLFSSQKTWRLWTIYKDILRFITQGKVLWGNVFIMLCVLIFIFKEYKENGAGD